MCPMGDTIGRETIVVITEIDARDQPFAKVWMGQDSRVKNINVYSSTR